MKMDLLFETWKGHCAYCGIKLELKPPKRGARGSATRDHFIPLAAGGGKGKRNHVLACQPCNAQKGAIDPRIMVRVWHELDSKGLRAFVDDLDPQTKRGIAGRIKALLGAHSRATKKLN